MKVPIQEGLIDNIGMLSRPWIRFFVDLVNLAAHSTVRVTTTYQIISVDDAVFADTDDGAFAVTLPEGVDGHNVKVINCGSSGNDLTVNPYGSETVQGNGAGVAITLADGESVNLHYNPTEGWW